MYKKTRDEPARSLTWTNKPPGNVGRQSRENIINTRCGPTYISNYFKTHLESWNIFMQDIIPKIVNNTNKKNF